MLARRFQLSVIIVDDNAAYFDEAMVKAARAHGLGRITRLFQVNGDVLNQLVQRPPDILILDVRGITTDDVAKDGLELADHLARVSSSYVVVTSAHKFHLSNRTAKVDYVIEQRLLTLVDFLDELRIIRDDCLARKKRFYQKLGLRAAIAIGRFAVSHSH